MMAREAIAMVSSGASRRVILAGIRFGDQILEPARRLGLPAGVRVNPIRSPEGTGSGLIVEPIYE